MLQTTDTTELNIAATTGLKRLLTAGYLTDDVKKRGYDAIKAARAKGKHLEVSMSDVGPGELSAALELVREKFHDTKSMVGKVMYRGDERFDFARDVKQELREFYINHPETKQSALKKRQFGALFYLVLEPVIDTFKDYKHEDALLSVDREIDNAIQYVDDNSNITPHPDDVFLARVLIAQEVARRVKAEAAKANPVIRKHVNAILKLRKKLKRRRK